MVDVLLYIAVTLVLITTIAYVIDSPHTHAKYELEHDKVFVLGKYIYLHVYDHVSALRACGLSNEDVYEIICSIEKED